jgi:subtilisin family serine protease/subtilisin-like proprotein convertase family protein
MKRDARRRFCLSLLEDRVVPTVDFLPDRIIVRTFGAPPTSSISTSVRPIGFGMFSVHLTPSVTVPQAIDLYRTVPGVQFAEPDFIIGYNRIPNDSSFNALWGLNNLVGQATNTEADINAPEAWEFHQGSGATTVAILDTGIDYSHPDLASNMWTNPGEVAGDGADNDGNGLVDDVFGYDFANEDADPFDDNGHGTHAAGTIGAVGDNGIGVVGVDWHARLMAVKFLGADGKGTMGNAIRALDYAVRMGARVSNNSWGGGGYSAAFCAAIEATRGVGHLFVAAAGNSGADNDATPNYPSSYALDNVLAVAATDRQDQLGSFTNYGATSVDLAAPGVGILSTYKNGQYATLSGSSMAAPYVAGAAAYLWDMHPEWSYAQVSGAILTTVDILPQLAGKVASSGRLNLARAAAFQDEWNGPQVTDHSWSDPPAGTLDTLRLTFNKPIAVATFTPADVALSGPNGSIAISSVTPVSGSDGISWLVKFPLQDTTGTYTAVVGPDVRDRSGNPMDQNGNGQNGDPTDTFVASTSLDRTGPRITDHAFLQDWAGVHGLRVTFDKVIDPESFTTDDVSVSGPNGSVDVTAVASAGGSDFEILFEGTMAGTYMVVVGPQITTPLGDPMDQNENGINGEADDRFIATTALEDQAGPRVTDVSYGGTATRLTSIRVTFSERIKGSTFTPGDVVLRGPTGSRISVSRVSAVVGSDNKQFDIEFADQTAGGTYTVTIGPNVADMVGHVMDQNANGTAGEAGDVFVGSTVLSTPVVRKPLSLDHNKPLTDGGRTISTLVVTEHIRISDLNVKVNITHGYASDLALTLVAPTGARVVLVYRRGGNGDGFIGTTFDDAAGRHISEGYAPFSGSFRPETLLSAFDGLDARGVWRLIIDDVSVGNGGRLNSWSLAISGTPIVGPNDPLPGEPAILPPLAVSYTAAKQPNRNKNLWTDVNSFFL